MKVIKKLFKSKRKIPEELISIKMKMLVNKRNELRVTKSISKKMKNIYIYKHAQKITLKKKICSWHGNEIWSPCYTLI